MRIIVLTDGVLGPYHAGEILVVNPNRQPVSGDYVIYPDTADGGELRLWKPSDKKPWGVVIGKIK
uniref:Uncharacterized protein n=1 Tax=Candidatus Kentrum sp. LFY TaxID=2126342 RepID=A0A450WC93_9GAMM|nr:MAG: hypothetical protein BECKLFY1418C_GA0070996_100937 [Candidatus Kentron sp. LFY]